MNNRLSGSRHFTGMSSMNGKPQTIFPKMSSIKFSSKLIKPKVPIYRSPESRVLHTTISFLVY